MARETRGRGERQNKSDSNQPARWGSFLAVKEIKDISNQRETGGGHTGIGQGRVKVATKEKQSQPGRRANLSQCRWGEQDGVEFQRVARKRPVIRFDKGGFTGPGRAKDNHGNHCRLQALH